MVDALRRNLCFTTFDAVVGELNERIDSGDFIRLIRNGTMEELTTSRTVAMERSNIQQVVAGRGTQDPILEPEESGRAVREITEAQGITLNQSQCKAVEAILESHDRSWGCKVLPGQAKPRRLLFCEEQPSNRVTKSRGLRRQEQQPTCWPRAVSRPRLCRSLLRHADGVRHWQENPLRDG